MPLRALVRFTDSSGREDTVTVSAMQKVIVGSSPVADIQLYDPRGVIGKHCEIEVSDRWCRIRSLDDNAVVQIDEKDLRAHELGANNVVAVGNNTLQIVVDGLEELANQEKVAEEAAPFQVSESFQFRVPELKVLGNGVRQFEFQSSELDVEVLKDQVVGQKTIWVLKNEKADGFPVGDGAGDLIENFPEDVRLENSIRMHGPFADEESKSKVIQENVSGENTLFFVPLDQDIDDEQLAKKMALLWGWMLTPDLVDFHLANGTDGIISSLFEHVEYLFYFLPDAGCWKIACIDDEVCEFSDLGRGAISQING